MHGIKPIAQSAASGAQKLERALHMSEYAQVRHAVFTTMAEAREAHVNHVGQAIVSAIKKFANNHPKSFETLKKFFAVK